MANEYFDPGTPLPRTETARAEAVNAKFDGVEAGFAKLPAPTAVKGNAAHHAPDTGSANACIVTVSGGPTTATDGTNVSFFVKAANTGAGTLSYNGWGALPLRRITGDALSAGDLSAGQLVDARYDGNNNHWKINAISSALVENAETQAQNAANSASAAASSASSAAGSASAAATSETNAANSETSAAASETNAATSETNADDAAIAAVLSATAAANSETSAATSASNAATSETNAGNSASAASTSATEADGAKTAAETASTSSQTALTSFQNWWIGSAGSDPVDDLNGSPVSEGQGYWNSTSKAFRIHNGSEFESISVATTAVAVSYNNADSGLSAVTVKAAIDELANQPGGSQSFVASGAVAAGNVVVLNNDGTVSVVDENGIDPEVHTETQYVSGWGYYHISCNPNGVFVIVYQENSTQDGFAVAATIDEATGKLKFGTPVEFETSYLYDTSRAAFSTLDPNLFCIAYRNGSSQATAILGQVEPVSLAISFGASSNISANSCNDYQVTFDSSNEFFVAAYQDASASNLKLVGILPGSGTAISSIGTPQTVISGSNARSKALAYDPDDNRLIFNLIDNSGNAYVYSYTVSGISSFSNTGTLYLGYSGASSFDAGLSYNTSDNVWCASYQDSSNIAYAKAFTCSGGSLSGGSAITIESSTNYGTDVSYNPVSDCFVFMSSRAASLRYHEVTNSGTALTEENTTNTSRNANTYVTGATDLAAGITACVTASGYYSTYSPRKSTHLNRIGLAEGALSDTDTGNFTIIGGVNDQQTGLTAGATYYVDYDGSLTTSIRPGARIGRALSATKILLEGDE